ncbi:MAG: hypothetical protein JO052_13330 [Bradyrhizobium sp.]|nr:hypothetical protein [Bradyrhizobium sp.]
MGMVMVRCPKTGRAIPTGIKIDRDSFRRRPVFYSRTHCPTYQIDHTWFAQDAWVHEAGRVERRAAEDSHMERV